MHLYSIETGMFLQTYYGIAIVLRQGCFLQVFVSYIAISLGHSLEPKLFALFGLSEEMVHGGGACLSPSGQFPPITVSVGTAKGVREGTQGI